MLHVYYVIELNFSWELVSVEHQVLGLQCSDNFFYIKCVTLAFECFNMGDSRSGVLIPKCFVDEAYEPQQLGPCSKVGSFGFFAFYRPPSTIFPYLDSCGQFSPCLYIVGEVVVNFYSHLHSSPLCALALLASTFVASSIRLFSHFCVTMACVNERQSTG
jgi:hypothetical protein